MTAENQQKDTNSNDRSITRYSSPVFNRGLELAKKVSIDKNSNHDEQIFSSKSIQDAEYFFKIAVEQISPSEYQYALMNFQKALDINPDYYEVYIIRYSLIYMPLGYYQEVINDCTQALRLQPDNAEVMTSRGWAYSQLGYQLQALQDYDLALIIRPDFETAYMNRGLSYMRCSNDQKAIGDFQQVINITPHNADAYSNKGLSLLSINKYQDALTNLNIAIQINSQHINAHLNMGLCYIHIADELLSADYFSRAIDLDSEHAKNYLRQLGEYGGQIDKLSSAVSLMLVNLGVTFHESNYEKAIEYYNHALILDPVCEEAYYKRGVAYVEIEYYQEAISDFNQVLLINPYNTDAYISKGVIQHKQGDLYAAIKDYGCAIKIDPTYELAFIKRGATLSFLGDKQGAISDYTKVIEFDTDNSLAYTLRGKVYYELGYELLATTDFTRGYILSGNQLSESGNYAEAIESYTHVLELDPYNVEAYNRRSTARSAIGDYQGAMEDLQQVRMI
jgi:tetratricopeptide (TPR) repeat protein